MIVSKFAIKTILHKQLLLSFRYDFVNALGFLTCSLILQCTCITLLHMMIQSTFLLNFKLVALILTIPRCQRWETTSWTKLFRRSVKNLSSQKSSRWPWRLGRCFFQAHVVIVCSSLFVFVLFFYKELAFKPSPALFLVFVLFCFAPQALPFFFAFFYPRSISSKSHSAHSI